MRVTRAALRARAAEDEQHQSAETSPCPPSNSQSRSPCRTERMASPRKDFETNLIIHEDDVEESAKTDSTGHSRQESTDMAARALKDITRELNVTVIGDADEKGQIKPELQSDPFVEHSEHITSEDMVTDHGHSLTAARDIVLESTDISFEGLERSTSKLGDEQLVQCEGLIEQAVLGSTEPATEAELLEDNIGPESSGSPESEKFAASFDAMDKLEDELEQVDAELKATPPRRVTIVSPPKVNTTTPMTRKSISAALSKRRSTPYRSQGRVKDSSDISSDHLKVQTSPSPKKPTTPRSILAGRNLNKNVTTPLRHKRAASTPLPAKSPAKAQSLVQENVPAKTATQVHKRRVTSTTVALNQKPFIPSKSSKPPTTSTFQLPGEVTAAKLKAAKEEREARRAAGQIVPAKPAAILVAKSTKTITTSTFSLPGEETAARLKAQKEEREARRAAGIVTEPEVKLVERPRKPSKPPTVSTFQLSSEATAAKLKLQKEEREARRAAGQLVPVPVVKAPRTSMVLKSSKPVTTSTFTLSSDATAAKLKAQREEREARRTAQEEKDKEEGEKERLRKLGRGHNRILSTSVKPSIVPRENKASKIRIASGGHNPSCEDKENLPPLKH